MNINNLKFNEKKLRDLYLRDLSMGKIQGPPTGKASQDKPWLVHYTEQQIKDFNDAMENGSCDCSIIDYMLKENKEHLDDIALYYYGTKITYRELIEKSDQFAASVLERGIKAGDVVTVCMPNTPEAVYAFYGLNKIGVIPNMIHPLSSANEIKNYLNEVDSKMLLTIDMALGKVESIVKDTKVKDVIVASPADSMPLPLKIGYMLTDKTSKVDSNKFSTFKQFIKLGKNKKVVAHEANANDTAVMLHTGGTTGRSKAACLSNRNFNAMVEQFKYNIDNFERGEKMLTVMPVFHGFGLCSSLHLPLTYGVGCILIPKLNPKQIGKIFKKYHPNHILGVPTLFKGIINCPELQNEDLSYVKNIVSGGDYNKWEKIINDFFGKRGAKISTKKGYGLTEIVAGATFASNEYNDYGSNGIPMIGTNLKLVKPGTNEEVMNGEMGEICLHGPTVMKEYYKNPEETAQTLQDGWLHTGDFGHLSNNQLYFDSRRGDIIISSGINVYPSEIEHVIEEHGSVSACAVIGIPDDYSGQKPIAYIVLKDGEELTSEIKSEIEKLCFENLNKYSIPKQFSFVDELPQTLLGKITRKELREKQKVKTR